jgi:hypothetical protein
MPRVSINARPLAKTAFDVLAMNNWVLMHFMFFSSLAVLRIGDDLRGGLAHLISAQFVTVAHGTKEPTGKTRNPLLLSLAN